MQLLNVYKLHIGAISHTIMDHINTVEKRHSIAVSARRIFHSALFVPPHDCRPYFPLITRLRSAVEVQICEMPLCEVIASGECVSLVSFADTATLISFATDLISPRQITGPPLSPEYIRVKIQSC